MKNRIAAAAATAALALSLIPSATQANTAWAARGAKAAMEADLVQACDDAYKDARYADIVTFCSLAAKENEADAEENPSYSFHSNRAESLLVAAGMYARLAIGLVASRHGTEAKRTAYHILDLLAETNVNADNIESYKELKAGATLLLSQSLK